MPRRKKRSSGKGDASVISTFRRIPHILLFVETSGSVGRGIIEGVSQYALERGPWSIKCEYRAFDSLPPHWLKSWRGDGIISRTVNMKQAKALWATKLPMVELFGDPQIGLAEIMFDMPLGGRMVVEHFLSCGLRNFAYFAYGAAWWTRAHQDGFLGALKERGHDCHVYEPPTRERMMPVWDERQQPRVIAWVRSLPRPIGILTPGDLHSMHLLDACRESDVAVPEEVAILGIGNDPLICDAVHPTLSSLDLDARRTGYEAARLLDQKMAGLDSKGSFLIPPSHVAVRQSTDMLCIEDPEVVAAIRFIRQFACSGIKVEEVVKHVAISRSLLEYRFRKHLGRSPQAEIRIVQVKRVKQLLESTDLSLEAIAQLAGYVHPEYMSVVFKRLTGQTPGGYRRQSVARDRKGLDAPPSAAQRSSESS